MFCCARVALCLATGISPACANVSCVSDGSAKSDALKKVEIAKLSDPKSPKNVALARIAKAKKKSQKAQDKLITQTKVKMAVKKLEKQQANAVDADKQAKKVDAQKAKLKKSDEKKK